MIRFPENFVLIILAMVCGVARHWIPELDSLLLVLIYMVKPGEPNIPKRD